MTLQTGPAWLFCPADRPERFQKAVAAADVVILDLEDGVAATDRDMARKALVDNPLDPATTVVRVNAAGTKDHVADLDVLAETAYTTVMLPKTESAPQVRALLPREVIVLVEDVDVGARDRGQHAHHARSAERPRSSPENQSA